VPALPAAHVGLIGPLHRRATRGGAGRIGRAGSQYRRPSLSSVCPQRRAPHKVRRDPDRRAESQGAKGPTTDPFHRCGRSCGAPGKCLVCRDFPYEKSTAWAVVRASARCYARRFPEGRER
jgi:hypothetical protein